MAEKMMVDEARRRCADVDWYLCRPDRTTKGWQVEAETPIDSPHNARLNLLVCGEVGETQKELYTVAVRAVEAIAAAEGKAK